jgi:hypothetical protein
VVSYAAVVQDEDGKENHFNTIDEYCELAIRTNHKNTTWIAHYARRFVDVFFVNMVEETQP